MSVRKRKWTTAKGEAKEAWQADYVDGEGKRQRQSFDKKKDADAFLLKAMSEVRDGVHVPDSETITVSAAGNLWLKSGTSDGLERTTLDQRRQHLTLHIVPFIGNTKLNKLTVPSIRAFQDTLRENGRSAAMIKRSTVSLGSILADSQLRGHSVRNPVHEMSRAKSSRTKIEKRQQKRLEIGVDIPTTAEIKALIAAAEGRWRPLIITAVFTGLRASELRGLRWADVDLASAMLHVRQRADRYHAIGMPKTDAGQRKVPLTPMTVNTLREWKLACPKGDLDLVFPTGSGKVEGHSNMVNRGLIPTMIAGGVATVTGRDDEGKPTVAAKYTGLHALRHWFASWCINRRSEGGLELSPKQVQERMGHSNIAVTLDTYSHLFPTQDEQSALAAAERSMFGV